MWNTMTSKAVKRLYDLEIDEISLVDRPANQHGVVAIAKRHQEDDMPGLFDADGDEVTMDQLEFGDYVYDEEGNEFQFVPEAEDGTTSEMYDDEYAPEDHLVGKSVAGFRSLDRAAKIRTVKEIAGRKGTRRAAGFAAGGAAAGGVAGYASKSLGSSVYEELSKALGQDERDQVISKMADQVEVYKSQAEQAMKLAEELAYQRELEEYTEIAKSYGLPVDAGRLGEILKNAADTLPEQDLADLDRLLQAQGHLYEELGTSGSMATSAVMDQVEAMAAQAVGKADMSEAMAVVELFSANPTAYDEYLSENR